MYHNAIKLCNKLLSVYFNGYNNVADKEKGKMGEAYNLNNLLIKGCRFIEWKKEDAEKSKSQPEDAIAERVKLRRQKADDNSDEFIDITDMPPLEVDEEEVKNGKGLKRLTPNKFLTRLSILLVQIKAVKNSNKLKNEIRQILYLLYQHNKITKKVYNNLMKSL